jgi:hypothetical protein
LRRRGARARLILARDPDRYPTARQALVIRLAQRQRLAQPCACDVALTPRTRQRDQRAVEARLRIADLAAGAVDPAPERIRVELKSPEFRARPLEVAFNAAPLSIGRAPRLLRSPNIRTDGRQRHVCHLVRKCSLRVENHPPPVDRPGLLGEPIDSNTDRINKSLLSFACCTLGIGKRRLALCQV